MVTIIYVGIRYVPTYDFTTPVTVPSPAAGATGTVPQLPDSKAPRTIQEGTKIDGSGLIRDKEDVWATVLTVSISGVLLVLVAGLAAGWVLSRRLLAPLHTISRAAAKAGEGNLAYRINAKGPEDELKQLADTFDTTLTRLEKSFSAHQRFAANASHELLTPLATTRAILQVAAADPRGEEFTELVPMLVETNERNITVVKELLQLAAADHAAFDPEKVELGALTVDVTRERGDAAVEVDVDVEDGCVVLGSATLLRQLVANLLDNAVRHNVPGGSVHVAVRHDTDVILLVQNTGPQVDPAVVDRLFEPFYRARPRIESERGHGLGLAIVRSVAQAHRGAVTAEANPSGGLAVRVTLPSAVQTGCGGVHVKAGQMSRKISIWAPTEFRRSASSS
ncbi:sensor histidine kinase [Streptomyces sp. SYSU K21746]